VYHLSFLVATYLGLIFSLRYDVNGRSASKSTPEANLCKQRNTSSDLHFKLLSWPAITIEKDG
jgi:hypothetical protein